MARPKNRPCLVCGIAFSNEAGVPIRHVVVVTTDKKTHHRTVSLSTSLCLRCLVEAQRDGRMASSSVMKAAIANA